MHCVLHEHQNIDVKICVCVCVCEAFYPLSLVIPSPNSEGTNRDAGRTTTTRAGCWEDHVVGLITLLFDTTNIFFTLQIIPLNSSAREREIRILVLILSPLPMPRKGVPFEFTRSLPKTF